VSAAGTKKIEKPTGVILMNMGSPERPEDVKPFLKKIFRDPAIMNIPLGFLLRRPLSTLIANLRAGRSGARYKAIGGKSPLIELNGKLAARLSDVLATDGNEWRVALAMRYTRPRAHEAVDRLKDVGVGRIIACPLYPHYCAATTGSSADEIRKLFRERAPDIPLSVISGYHDYPSYIDAVSATVRETLLEFTITEQPYVVTIFSAHSVPEKLARRGDPYVDHVRLTAEKVADMCALRHWRLAFQSRGGPGKWVGPNVEDTFRLLLSLRTKCVLVVPLSFTCDNLETLYDIDIEINARAKELGFKMKRAPALNIRPDFTNALAAIIREELGKSKFTTETKGKPRTSVRG
jgi:ferrochelatase